jgi:glycine cleavage system regulatory protein
LFRLVADLASPNDVGLDELREVLESLANDLMVDISLHADRRDVD